MKQLGRYFLSIVILFLLGCSQTKTIEDYGLYYQKHKDYASLKKVVALINLESDSSYVSAILGEPINMGFDYRYLIDSIGPKNCSIGAVFHFNESGKVDQKWIDEICE